jgi:hypothetical protein
MTRLDGPGFETRQNARDFSLPQDILTGSGAHLTFYLPGAVAFALGVNRPVREADHSVPSSAEIKNEWSYTPTPPTCLHGVERGSFIMRKMVFGDIPVDE